jgi:hypothetical protein
MFPTPEAAPIKRRIRRNEGGCRTSVRPPFERRFIHAAARSKEEEPMGCEGAINEPLDKLRIALATMRTRKELANPAVRVHVERYLERAEAEIEYLAALRDRASLIGMDDDRERLALDRAERAVRLAGAKLYAAVAEERGDRRAEAEANRRAAEIVIHLEEAENDEDDEDSLPG